MFVESRGEAWREIKAWITALPPAVDALHIPAVSEPFLAWTTSGVVDFQERERHNQLWITHRIQHGSFFLTSGDARMGLDPSTSVLNPYNQCWDANNVFVTDASCFVSTGTVGPTLTIMALTARACDYIAREF